MVDVDHVAVLRMEAGELHHAAGRRHHRRTDVGEEIDAFVHRPLAGERIDAAAKARSLKGASTGIMVGISFFFTALLEKLRLEHAEHVVAVLDAGATASRACR